MSGAKGPKNASQGLWRGFRDLMRKTEGPRAATRNRGWVGK